jgi:N6-adenosine-specific RNA methylase IME4
MDFKIYNSVRDHIPRLSEPEYECLKEQIKEYGGCRDPLVVGVINTEDNKVLLDGHHRHEICQELGEEYSYKIETMRFDTIEDALAWVEDNQLGRRNLTPDQFRYYLGRKYERAKKAQGGRADRDFSGRQNDAPKTAQKIAQEHGTSPRTVERAADYANNLDEINDATGGQLKQSVLSGEGSLTTKDIGELAEEKEYIEQEGITFSNEKEAEEWLKERRKQKAEEKKAERVEKIAELSEANEELSTEKRYPVIYCDPPWQYEFSKSETRAIENQYPTMNLDELKELPVPDIAYDDCALFLWTTSPKLKQALELLDSWDFEYKTCAIWDKKKIGMGYYFRQQHELLIVATKGNIPAPDPNDRPSSIISAERGTHSSKPEEVYNIIEAMYPDFSKIELFARINREGWDSWGNQAET